MRDPHLKQLGRQDLVHRSYLLGELPAHTPGIYTVGGGRQIGKTTLMKQWMALLMKMGVAPESIAYFTGELIDDHHALVRVVGEAFDAMPGDNLAYLILDEVTYIRDWDKGVKYLADAGMLQRVCLDLSQFHAVAGRKEPEDPPKRGRIREPVPPEDGAPTSSFLTITVWAMCLIPDRTLIISMVTTSETALIHTSHC